MMSPPLIFILVLCVAFGALTTLFMVVSVSTDYWEEAEYNESKLLEIDNLVKNDSIFEAAEGFWKLVILDPKSGNKTVYVLRNTYGGSIKICDKISHTYRASTPFTEALETQTNIPTKILLQAHCFSYIKDYYKIRDYLSDDTTVKSNFLFKMQNSASSSGIVAILCVGTAIITGIFGIWQKQVSSCMVTGVMYIVAGVFIMFDIIIMLTKIDYQRTKQCYNLDLIIIAGDICDARQVRTGWSVSLAWVSFAMSILTLGVWLLLSRYFRLETAKSLV